MPCPATTVSDAGDVPPPPPPVPAVPIVSVNEILLPPALTGNCTVPAAEVAVNVVLAYPRRFVFTLAVESVTPAGDVNATLTSVSGSPAPFSSLTTKGLETTVAGTV